MFDKTPLGPHPDFPFCMVMHEGDFCYTEPYPTHEQLAEYYNSTYRAVRQEAPTADYVRFMQARAKAQSRFIFENSGRSQFEHVLDIGSGCGTLLAELGTSAGFLEGWEPDVAMCRHAQEHFASDTINFVNGLFIPGNSEKQFDLITMSHVLEHVPQPGEFLEKLRTLHLAQSGCIFIEVPNDPVWWVRIQLEKQFKGLGHVNFFTPASLNQCLVEAKFEAVIAQTSGMQVRQFAKRRVSPEPIISKLRRRLRFPTRQQLPDYSTKDGYRDGIYLQALAFKQ
jgi:2-polyprenyl-3-methyl-5-hydroxy-6-metoxy-1,4-benzoquinol methylase